MSQINPFTGSILQAPQVQRQQAAEKDRHLRRVNDQAKNAALQDEQLEHQVESTDAVAPTDPEDQQRHRRQRESSQRPDQNPDEDGGDEKPHVDLTA